MRVILKQLSIYVSLFVILFPYISIADESGIVVELLPSVQRVKMMEAIDLELRITNKAVQKRILFQPIFGPHIREGLVFYIKEPQEKNFKRIDFPYIHTGAVKMRTQPKYASVLSIMPDSVYDAKFQLHYNFYSDRRYHWLFSSPGIYRIKALVYSVNEVDIVDNRVLYNAVREPLYSNEVTVVVDEIVNDKDRQMLDEFNNIEGQYRLYQSDPYPSGLKVNTKTYKDVKNFMRHYPNSYLAKRTEMFIKTEDDAVLKYIKRMENIEKFQKEEKIRQEEKRIQNKIMYDELTEQQKKDIELAKAEQTRIIAAQKAEKAKNEVMPKINDVVQTAEKTEKDKAIYLILTAIGLLAIGVIIYLAVTKRKR